MWLHDWRSECPRKLVTGPNTGDWKEIGARRASDNRGTTNESTAVRRLGLLVKGQSFLVAKLKTLRLLLSEEPGQVGASIRYHCRMWRVWWLVEGSA
jgi:hypothetical protein